MYVWVWGVIAVAVLLSALLIYLEHEWGVLLGVTTGVVICILYFVIGPMAQLNDVVVAAIILTLLVSVVLGYHYARKIWRRMARPEVNARRD